MYTFPGPLNNLLCLMLAPIAKQEINDVHM
jgi:hypothetical protein